MAEIAHGSKLKPEGRKLIAQSSPVEYASDFTPVPSAGATPVKYGGSPVK